LELKGWLIIEPMNTKVNKFRKTYPEALFYWHKIYELLITKQVNVQTKKEF
jgi:hypothetical protein